MKVEIWSDVVCPWCYIGKRRFESALEQFPHRDQVEVEWRSFELDPSAPRTAELTGTHVEQLAAKFGRPVSAVEPMLANVAQQAAGEGLDFRFDLNRGGNSFDAHRLLHLAKGHGLQNDLKERLDQGTFTEGLGVSEHEELTKLAVEVGLPEAEVRDTLASDRFAADVRDDEQQAAAYGISGVPFFVIDGKYGVSGAQPADLFLQGLTEAWGARSPLQTLTSAPAPGCEGDACEV